MVRRLVMHRDSSKGMAFVRARMMMQRWLERRGPRESAVLGARDGTKIVIVTLTCRDASHLVSRRALHARLVHVVYGLSCW